MKFVLDSSALIAFIRNEDGADIVEQLLLDESAAIFMHAINLCEVYYDCIRAVGEEKADSCVNAIITGNVVIREDMDVDFWKTAGKLKALGRISISDTFAVALAVREGAHLVTSDHHEFDPLLAQGKIPINILFIR